ncbi:proton extrusion protein PcxA [Alkalinema pantanalense CENA528]|uniref:proton extrusion protein PcxA n=1 Tax=Alkalinema pantanalense TaxID=1620705 RepID=UPI003D6E339A
MVSFLSRLRAYLQRAEQWYLTTPDRALDEAYDAALMIQALENEHFGGQKIGSPQGEVGQETYAYFEQELNKHLKTIRLRLSEFRLSRSTLNVTNPKADRKLLPVDEAGAYSAQGSNGRLIPTTKERTAISLEKLQFVDRILARYQVPMQGNGSTALVPVKPSMTTAASAIPPTRSSQPSLNSYHDNANLSAQILANQQARNNKKPDTLSNLETISDKTGVLPRSILGTIGRLKQELDPNAEYEVMQDFQAKRQRTKMAIRFILILVAVPILVQVSVRNVALSDRFIPGHWISHQFAITNPSKIFLNGEMTEQALKSLTAFEERLKFEALLRETLGMEAPEVEVQEEKVRDRVRTIAKDYSHRSANAVKNWIADLSGVMTFIFILTRGRVQVESVKGFIDEIAYGLSDSAKAFIIILFTDVFVGFHSPHGWEVLLEGVSEHLGIPPSRNFIFLFIATFPVILDTIFKYWIFRYLNRISPSAVATYKEMNE